MTTDPNTTGALLAMARHVAAQLVADALKGMATSNTAVTVTVHPQAPASAAPGAEFYA